MNNANVGTFPRPCPRCGVDVGEGCISASGDRTGDHVARLVRMFAKSHKSQTRQLGRLAGGPKE